AAGYSRAEAARVARIDPTTLKRWLRRGRRDIGGGQKSEHAALAELVTEVEQRTGLR
ncbi:MAG: hypothetical protein JWO38_1388, partial [Gemmataceae bacterium]|nr:hypothetical protein [Gemmataceae bacterium]